MQKIETFSANSDDLLWEISELAGHYHVTCLHAGLGLAGSGFALLKETAKKKAFAELNERFIVDQLNSSDAKSEWVLNFDESCSGFAVGYTKSKAVLRAVCEGSERWALSKWVDEHFALEEVSFVTTSPVAAAIRHFFTGFSVYKNEVPVMLDNNVLKVQIAVALGWSDKGVFAGYGSKLNLEDAMDHAFVEALRNFLIYRNQRERSSFPYNRIKFFAENKDVALEVLCKSKRAMSQLPVLKLLKAEQFGDLWIARAVFDGWTPWQRESISRFLY
ncbi:MAG: YcaO-like family protein [Bdellovibrionaceae bacterium]|nr:YcaO-like family protein [Pseudobdellovibrionaceae bacterium]